MVPREARSPNSDPFVERVALLVQRQNLILAHSMSCCCATVPDITNAAAGRPMGGSPYARST